MFAFCTDLTTTGETSLQVDKKAIQIEIAFNHHITHMNVQITMEIIALITEVIVVESISHLTQSMATMDIVTSVAVIQGLALETGMPFLMYAKFVCCLALLMHHFILLTCGSSNVSILR